MIMFYAGLIAGFDLQQLWLSVKFDDTRGMIDL